ncbi:MAG: hypothetical protein E7180_02735 [Erysipelotrichaceae bacterium]|nr:hypothetical protein [Erysipelotrichaceae bacterium]
MKNNRLFLVLSMLLCSTLVTSCTIRRAPSSEATSSEEPSTQVTTSEESSSEEVTSEEISSEEVTSEEISKEDPSSEEVTSEEISSEEISNEDPSSEDPVTSEIPSTSEDPSSEEVTSEESSSEELSSEEVTSEESSSEELSSEEVTSEEISSEEVTSEEISSEEVSSEDPSSEEVTSEIPSTSEEPSSEEVTSEEISSEESSSEENNTETCKMTIGEEEYELTIKTDSDMSDGKLYEYEIKDVTVSAKDVVVFYINGEVIGTDVLGTGTSGGNNIKIDGDKFVIRQDATANVYFKVYESGYSVWVSGYEDTVVYDFYLRGSFSNWNADNDYAFVHHDEDEVKLENVTLKAGDKFKVVQNNDASNHEEWWHGFATVKDGCKDLVTDDGGNIVIKDSGTYTFYWDWDDFQLWIAKAN